MPVISLWSAPTQLSKNARDFELTESNNITEQNKYGDTVESCYYATLGTKQSGLNWVMALTERMDIPVVRPKQKLIRVLCFKKNRLGRSESLLFAFVLF